MKAARIHPTDPSAWPVDPESVPRPRITTEIGASLYRTRMAGPQTQWDEMDRILAANRTAWRRELKARKSAGAVVVDRQEQAEGEA